MTSDPKKEIQPADNSDPAPYLQFEKRDETQIVKEMSGETALLDEYVYSFKQGNRTVTSLSYAGVKEMVRRRGNFKILDVQTEETDQTIRARITIKDLVNNVEFLGASETEKSKPFAYVLSINKAERNAYMKVMPTEFLAKMVDSFLHPKGQPKYDVERVPEMQQPKEVPKLDPNIPKSLQPNVPPQNQPQPQVQPLKLESPMDIEAQFPEELRELLDFRFADDCMLIKPKKFLGGDLFPKVASIVRAIGGEYISAGTDSHFKVPLRENQ
jgi:hypothetical protein